MVYRNRGDIAWEATQEHQRRLLRPIAEVFVSNATAPIGLTREGRTVTWMRDTQAGVTYLFAKAGEILGSFPAVIMRDFIGILTSSPSIIIQKAATVLLACKLFPGNYALGILFYNYFNTSSNSNYRSDAYYITITGSTYVTGAVGAIVGSVASSIIVPPVAGAVNVVEYLIGNKAA